MSLMLYDDAAALSANLMLDDATIAMSADAVWHGLSDAEPTAQEPNYLAGLIAGLLAAERSFDQENVLWQGSGTDFRSPEHAHRLATSDTAQQARTRTNQITDQLANILGHLVPSLLGCQTLGQTMARLRGSRSGEEFDSYLRSKVDRLPVNDAAKQATTDAYTTAMSNGLLRRKEVKTAVEELEEMSQDQVSCLRGTDMAAHAASSSCGKWLKELRRTAESLGRSTYGQPSSWSKDGLVYKAITDRLATEGGQKRLREICTELIKIDLALEMLRRVSGYDGPDVHDASLDSAYVQSAYDGYDIVQEPDAYSGGYYYDDY